MRRDHGSSGRLRLRNRNRPPHWPDSASDSAPVAPTIADVVLFALLVLLSGALLVPGLLTGPSLDAAVFSHIGGRLLDGVPPYLGAWDHKPPGIYLLAAGAHALSGWLGPWAADWAVSVAATAGIGYAVAATLARSGVIGWPRLLAAAGSTILAGQYLLSVGGGLTEPPATLLVGSALVLALGASSIARSAAIGALVGTSLIFSFQLVPGGAVVLAIALGMAPTNGRGVTVGAAAAGFLTPLVLVALWLASVGALPSAVDAVIGYSAAYRGASAAYGGILGAPVAAWTVLASLFLILPALLGPGAVRKTARPDSWLGIGAVLWIGFSLLLFVAQGRFYAHYAIPLAVPLGILAGMGLKRVGESLRRTARLATRVVVVLPVAFAVTVSVAAGIVGGAMELAPIADESARLEAVARRLRDLPDGALLVWGNEPRLYNLAGRPPATRYSYLYPLTTPGYSTRTTIDDVARLLAADPPEVVVDAGSSGPGQPGFVPLLIDRPVATDGRDLDLLDPIRRFVAERYQLTETVAGWPIYVLRTGQ